jgi:hypothetical protein
VEPPHLPWRPLGQLLVDGGLITADDLEKALAEQKRTGGRLGEIIVERGLISWPALTKALAAQYGLEVVTENGFGTGLWTEIERRHEERRSGTDRRRRDRRRGDRRQGDRRHGDRRQAASEEPATPAMAPDSPEKELSLEQLDEAAGRNEQGELEILRARHHEWLVDLTEKLHEQHGYLVTAAEKIEEHEQSLAELRLANETLNGEIERLRTEVKRPETRSSTPRSNR